MSRVLLLLYVALTLSGCAGFPPPPVGPAIDLNTLEVLYYDYERAEYVFQGKRWHWPEALYNTPRGLSGMVRPYTFFRMPFQQKYVELVNLESGKSIRWFPVDTPYPGWGSYYVAEDNLWLLTHFDNFRHFNTALGREMERGAWREPLKALVPGAAAHSLVVDKRGVVFALLTYSEPLAPVYLARLDQEGRWSVVWTGEKVRIVGTISYQPEEDAIYFTNGDIKLMRFSPASGLVEEVLVWTKGPRIDFAEGDGHGGIFLNYWTGRWFGSLPETQWAYVKDGQIFSVPQVVMGKADHANYIIPLNADQATHFRQMNERPNPTGGKP